MLRKVRKLEISLAAKCQLLFGLAVVLIIGAALWVPWRRIEQLMSQLNENAAETLAAQTISDHVVRNGLAPALMGEPRGTFSKPPSTQPIMIGEQTFAPPRLLLVNDPIDPDRLTRYERSAVRQLRDHPDRTVVTRLGDEATRFRYVRTDRSCIQCHATAVPGSQPLRTTGPTTASKTANNAADGPPTSAPALRMPIGFISVDIPNQVQSNQSLLNRVFILTAGLLAGTLAIITFYLITTRLILQPVRVLQETAEKVSEGDLNIRSDISTGDEFQQLSETFNIMLANLKQSADQLRAVNKSLDLRLGQLAESNVALYESNRLKSEFLANVSHELRTPLNSILGFAELLKDQNDDDPKSVRYVQNILGSGRNLLDLINDLLDLAKIEAGRMEVRAEPLSLADLFEGLVSLLKPLTEPKTVTIAPSVFPEMPIVQTDPSKLQQVLYNLLSNAIKFSPTGSRIDLSAERVGDERVRISVADQGPGIAPDKQEVIFEKFRQVDASVTRQHGGTGLGLSISKELAVLLGGKIGVVSVPGNGATFWIELPLRIEAASMDVRGKTALNS